jgi:dTDP-4-amino-4,6-dideoxygalactose transaminase
MIPHARPVLTDTHMQAVLSALKNCQLSQGPQVATLEKTLTERYPDRRAVAVSSGTAALYVALTLLDLPTGSEVIIPAYTCNALFCAVSHAGLKPVCADVGEGSVVITAETVQQKITAKTSAIIAPHTFGVRAPIEQIQALGFPVIEDCAQALGGRNPDGTPLGSTGDLAVLSFYATKPIPGGEGGIVLLPAAQEKRARALRDCDEADPDPRAFNFKMSDIHAALINSTLAGLEPMCAIRNRLADRFDPVFGNTALHQTLSTSATPQALCFRYLIRTDIPAETLIEKFEALGIHARRPIWKPLHLSSGESCPRTDKLHQALASVPLFPDLTESEIEEILASGQKIIGDLT